MLNKRDFKKGLVFTPSLFYYVMG